MPDIEHNASKHVFERFSPTFFVYVALIAMLAVFCYLCVVGEREKEGADFSKAFSPISEDWFDENGNEVDIENLGSSSSAESGGSITIYHRIPANLDRNLQVIFLASGGDVTVELDGVVIYTYTPTIPAIAGKSVGEHFHAVTLPEGSGSGERVLSITLTPDYPDDSAWIYEPALSTNEEYLHHFMGRHLGELVLSLLISTLGVLMFVLAFALPAEKNEHNGMVSLGMVALFASLWLATQTMVLQLLIRTTSIFYIGQYYLVMAEPFIAVSFVADNVKINTKPYRIIAFSVLAGDLVITIASTLLGGPDEHELLPITHAFIVLAAILIAIMVIKDFRANWRNQKIQSYYRILWFGVLVLVVCTVIDLIRYAFDLVDAVDASIFTGLGTLVFVICAMFYYTRLLVHQLEEAKVTEIYRKLAYTDVLTSLGNRAACEQQLNALDELESATVDFCIVVLDVNNLKRVNDYFGHDAGDKFLIAAAECITDAFGAEGNCFRTGGDEFCVIMHGKNLESRYEECVQRLRKGEAARNASGELPMPLYIACGMAISADGNDMNARDASRVADRRMYANKQGHKNRDDE